LLAALAVPHHEHTMTKIDVGPPQRNGFAHPQSGVAAQQH
jgi:hypothetical protein